MSKILIIISLSRLTTPTGKRGGDELYSYSDQHMDENYIQVANTIGTVNVLKYIYMYLYSYSVSTLRIITTYFIICSHLFIILVTTLMISNVGILTSSFSIFHKSIIAIIYITTCQFLILYNTAQH